MTDQTDLVALLGSRICHDLISPIGAIGNGVELLLMEGGPPSPELALIAESVASANARIRFFRIAFGMSAGTQHIGRGEITNLLSDIGQGGRVVIDWKPKEDVARDAAKLVFLAMMCSESALAYGGRITVSAVEAKWNITARAERLRIEPDLWESLAKPKPDLVPAQVHFALFAREITQQKRRLATEISQTEISLSF